MTDELLLESEVSEILRTPAGTLSYWRSLLTTEGKAVGPAWFKVGRGVRYRRSAVESYIEQQERAARTGAA